MLPVAAAIPDLLRALDASASAVLVAPPGAGKTTGVPPALLGASWRGDGRILVVEPRRLAARAAASRMAGLAGEAVGRTYGYRVRNDTKVSGATRVEMVTSGVFVRMILDDPGLDGISAVLFDEVHERSVDTDLGLALAIDAQQGLRPELRLLAMSATLDGERFAGLLGGAPLVASEGRLFPVETQHLGRRAESRIEDQVADAVLRALRSEEGSVLAFLPGQAEIRRTAERLAGRLPPDTILAPLFGAMEARAQDQAIRPAPEGSRKVVLATSIAETSITIEGVRVVVDSGLARRPRYDPGSGLTRLETLRVSRAGADQRRGRAGRTAPGICYRLWDAPQDAALQPFDRPEIMEADLAPLALSLLSWGVADPAQLSWLDPPPEAAFAEALDLLDRLGARDPSGGLSAHGRVLLDLPLPPRLGHMLVEGARRGEGALAADIAALLSEPGLGGRDADLRHRLESFRRDRSERARAARQAASRWTSGLARGGGAALPDETGAALLALAFPERVAQARGGRGRFRLANGRGAFLDEADALAREPFLAVAELQGGGADARILLAAPISRAAIESLFADAIVAEDRASFDAEADLVRAARIRRLGAVILAEISADAGTSPEAARLLAEAVLARGLDTLPWPEDLRALRRRIGFLRARQGEDWPDLSDAALAERAADWLVPALEGKRRLAAIGGQDLRNALSALLPWARMADLDRLAPARFAAPSGASAAIDYASGEPVVAIRVQNLFGIAEHPAVLGGAVPIVFELLSPAQRPIQVTRDLPSFWRGSWRDVRAEMRGRYPKHAWPEDPAAAEPLSGVRRR